VALNPDRQQSSRQLTYLTKVNRVFSSEAFSDVSTSVFTIVQETKFKNNTKQHIKYQTYSSLTAILTKYLKHNTPFTVATPAQQNPSQTRYISVSPCRCQYFVCPPFCLLRSECIVRVNAEEGLLMTMGLSRGEYEVSDMHQHTACSHCIETHLRQALEECFSNGGARTTGL